MASGHPSATLLAGAISLAAGLAPAQPLETGPTVATPPASYGAYHSAYGSYGASSGAYSSDGQTLLDVLGAAKSGDGSRIRAGMNALPDPTARKIALWALTDAAPDSMSFAEADAARGELDGWPRAVRRQMAAENGLAASGLSAPRIIAWFGGEAPSTARGAMALAAALQATGQVSAAADLIRRTWRTQICDQQTQDAMLARFGGVLTSADHVAREDLLLYGPQGSAAEDMLRLLPADQQALAQARMAVRRGASDAQSLIDALPYTLRNSPGLVYEQVLAMIDRGQADQALSLVGSLPSEIPLSSAAERIWKHGALISAALKQGQTNTAYAAAAHSGLTTGSDAAEAQFYAGWIALTKLRNARLADGHFAKLEALGASPLTQSRALYWRGRAAEASGDELGAQLFFSQAAKYNTTFYGQLAATKGADDRPRSGDHRRRPGQLRGHGRHQGGPDAERDRRQGYLQEFCRRPFRSSADGRRRGHAGRSRPWSGRPGNLHAHRAQRRQARHHPARARLSDPHAAGGSWGPRSVVRARHRSPGEQLRCSRPLRRRRAGHDAADARHGGGSR